MVRCTEFYERWKRHPNFCEKSPDAVRQIDHYLTLVEDLESTGIDAALVYKNFPEGAAREVLKIKDEKTLEEVLFNAAGMIKRGQKVSRGDITTWAGMTKTEPKPRPVPTIVGSSISEPSVKPPTIVGSSISEPAVKSPPPGWHPSTNSCQGCILLGYARDEGRKTPHHICCEIGKPPFGLEKCPIGTGPVRKVDCEHWGEDTLCHATIDTLCDQGKMERVHCPIGHPEALELIRRQAGRNPQTGKLTTEYCRIRNCPDLKKREMNNTFECSIAGNVPGNLVECPKLKPAPGKLEVIPEQPEDDEDENLCSWFEEDGTCSLTEDGDMSCADLCDATIRKERNCKLSGPPQPDPAPIPRGDLPLEKWSLEYKHKYPVTTACRIADCKNLKFEKPGLYICSIVGMRPENLNGRHPLGCPNQLPPPEPIPPAALPSPRQITPPATNPNLQRYTVEANRQDQAAIRQMIQRGLAEDEDEAVQSCFEEGLNLFMDRIEAQIQKEEEDQEVLGE